MHELVAATLLLIHYNQTVLLVVCLASISTRSPATTNAQLKGHKFDAFLKWKSRVICMVRKRFSQNKANYLAAVYFKEV